MNPWVGTLVVVVLFVAWYVGVYRGSNAHQADKRKMESVAHDQEFQRQGLSHNEDGHPACPKCGGTQFKLRRTPGRRAGIGTATVLAGGVGALAAAGKQKVQCITCGLFYNTL